MEDAFLSSRGGRVGRCLDLDEEIRGEGVMVEQNRITTGRKEGRGRREWEWRPRRGDRQTDRHRTPLPDLFLSLNHVNIIIDSNYPAPVLC